MKLSSLLPSASDLVITAASFGAKGCSTLLEITHQVFSKTRGSAFEGEKLIFGMPSKMGSVFLTSERNLDKSMSLTFSPVTLKMALVASCSFFFF